MACIAILKRYSEVGGQFARELRCRDFLASAGILAGPQRGEVAAPQALGLGPQGGEGSGGPGRKLYEITPAGSSELRRRRRDWAAFTATASDLLGTNSKESHHA